MIAVIIAGGSGTRLWPLSTPDYPKHLLKINGDSRSLLQKTYERAKKIADTVYVVSEKGHIKHVKKQLPELPESAFICEPARRGTANCVVAALSNISKHHSDHDLIAIMHADHYIRDEDGFQHTFQTIAQLLVKHQQIVLVGVEPTYPATAFGYIQKGKLQDEALFVYNVEQFKEKPDHNTALEYLKSGNYLWNCGYFIASLATFKREMKNAAPELLAHFEALQNVAGKDYDATYLGFTSDAIDYALIEKVKHLLVVPASFDWMDLGSFNDLHTAVMSDQQGNHIHGQNVKILEVENSFIQNYETKPVAVIGLDNVVVINSPNGVLVARKDLSQKVGEISKQL